MATREKIHLTPWAHELIHTLAWNVRVVSAMQLARFWSVSLTVAKRRLRRIRSAGLVECETLAMHDWQLTAPVVNWKPGAPTPNFSTLAWRLEKRWANLSYQRNVVVWVTQHGVNLVGGFGGRLRQRLQVQHDLGVAAVYFAQPKERQHDWIGEDFLRRLQMGLPALKSIPDAAIRTAGIEMLVEFAGKYDKDKLTRFHRNAKKLGVRYEIW